ncbi:hypothetical protein BAE44_0006497 [Dichanthelium oligosanthes]|uniref:Retrovirus-related Pol polyprotein from transposon TNT 1-94-like beta-barrel domain-containing protein n=1 Tax=Dichanthelium oligosanthes TaxID=888268 RepID=A0A1E5W559_9POAL|nr:hypothetical protein BAE44_0006497 [Dichanthelium oligosanthes]
MFPYAYKLHQALSIVLPKYIGRFSTVLTLLLLVDVVLRGPNPSNASKGASDNSSENAGRATWFMATAACNHMTGNRSLILDLSPVSNRVVYSGNGSPMEVCGTGSVETPTVVLHDVWYVPELTENLVSVGQLTELNLSIVFGGGECTISKTSDGSVVGKAHMGSDGMYAVDSLKVQLN